MNLFLFIPALVGIYIILNLFFGRRINSALYLKEERREFHKKLIWFLPFIGPLIIKSFWSGKTERPLEINARSKRKNPTGSGIDNWKNTTGLGGNSNET